VIGGLGNPGPEYAATRHNVGWWLADRLGREWGLGAFRPSGAAWATHGFVGGHEVLLLKPNIYMNRSGAAFAPALTDPTVDIAKDLLVVVDDAALAVGRIRMRPAGSAGGHNGLRSVESTLGTQEYGRLRVGVGLPPDGVDLSDWVLSPFDEADEQAILDAMPELVQAIRTWMDEGMEAAMSRHNR